MRLSSILGDDDDDKPTKMVHIKKIDNGFVVETCGMGKDQSEFVKKLSQASAVVARFMGIKGKKSNSEINDEYGAKETETKITIQKK